MTSGSPNNPLAAFMAVPQAIAKAQIELASNAAQAWFRLFAPTAAPPPSAIAEAIAETGQQVAEAFGLKDAPLSTDRPVHGQPSAPPAPVKAEPVARTATAKPEPAPQAEAAPAPPAAAKAAPRSVARPAPKSAPKAMSPAATVTAPVAKSAGAKTTKAIGIEPPSKPARSKAKAPDLVPESALAFDDAFVTPRMPPLLDAPEGEGDDFAVIKGIGPKLSKLLNELGVHHYRQIALWTPEEIAWINDKLDFKGRVQRERWVQQARSLAGLA